MIEIKDLLKRFNKILSTGTEEREILAKVLFDVVGVSIDQKDIKIKGDSVYLNIKPIYKNQILIKSEEIKSKLESLGQKTDRKIF